MSFILDALKKSESERNRQAGPTLLEVRVTPRRQRLPVWVVIIIGALALNLLVLGYLLLRTKPAAIPTTASPSPARPLAAPAAAPAPAPAPVLPDPALATTPLPSPAEPAAASVNPADYAPAVAAPQAQDIAGTAPVGGDAALPSLNDLNASGAAVPELHLSLHVYDPDPAKRYVLLNSTRLREGETTPDGLRLERITETGVVLSWRARRFTLQRGE
jgi:general secretion pathway protein B